MMTGNPKGCKREGITAQKPGELWPVGSVERAPVNAKTKRLSRAPRATIYLPAEHSAYKVVDGRTWDRTRDLSRVKRALSR